jgi:DNA-binding Xre family transcriptional regulator
MGERGEKNLQLSTLERVCASLDVPMWKVIRDAEWVGVGMVRR